MINMIKYFLTLALVAGVGIVASAQVAPKKKVAVYMTGSSIDENYKKVIGAKLVSVITESGEYAAVERTADFLAAISAENDYQTSGEVRDSQIAALGQKFGVRFVVVADVSEVFNELFIASRMINVETGLVEKAFDANGPAESMAQLINLSKSVAAGLLKGLSSSQGVSDVPVHMSLCVIDINGKAQYITTDQWQNMSEPQKIGYTKKGVVIAENGDAFLVAMHDSGMKNWYWASINCNLPSKWQGLLMSKYLDPLNIALKIFGGTPIIDTYFYWANETDSSSAWGVNMGSGNVSNRSKTYTARARAVAPVPVVSAR